MENPEVPMEKVHEHLEEHAHEAKEKWVMFVALSTAIIAVMAAVCSLLAGEHADEAMLSQIKSSDQWNYYQAKGIKWGQLKTRIDLLTAMGHEPAAEDTAKLKEYEDDQVEIKKKAGEEQEESNMHLRKNTILARGVTMFQIAIAIGAISVLTKRRAFWGVSLAFGMAGVWFLLRGLLA
jgi:Domain of unknown function (DUF4337)